MFCAPQMRVLTLQISELERSIHTSKISLPDLPGIDRDIASLKADLLRVRPDHSDASAVRAAGCLLFLIVTNSAPGLC